MQFLNHFKQQRHLLHKWLDEVLETGGGEDKRGKDAGL